MVEGQDRPSHTMARIMGENQDMTGKKHEIDVDAIRSVERDDVSFEDLEGVMGRVLTGTKTRQVKSENREPSREELSQRWKLTRR